MHATGGALSVPAGFDERDLATVLFTDLVGSTRRVAELGDERWRAILEEHQRAVRRELARHRGTEVDTAGDGFFCRFDGPARAIACARRIVDDARGIDLEVRAGVHTGECQVAGQKLAGIAVHVGARVMAAAAPGEVLVSSTVKDLVAGSDFAFADRGEPALKGVARAGPAVCSGTVTAMTDALIIDAIRTPIGRRNGALAGVRADELAAQALNGLVDRLDVDPAEIEDVQMGCVSQVGEQALNVARMSSLVAGWPETVCGTSVDRQCGSSMQAAFNAASAIQAGHLDVVVASGVESMSRVPMGSNLTANGFEGFSPKLYEHWEVVPQGISAEVLADEWELSREDLDEYSYESHRRAIAAIDEGRFEREIVPVEVGAGGAAVLVATDENPRRDTSLEKLASLKPAFKEDGKVTAGNSSAIVDGAAAMLVTSNAAASRLGLEPRGRFVSFGLAGVDPYRMLHGNPRACERALAKAGLTWDDIAVIEVNEAFASVVLQFLKDTGLRERWEAGDVNPNGSGISLGHPLGATGARITATLLGELHRREARYGVASMCIGQGQAIAAVVERL